MAIKKIIVDFALFFETRFTDANLIKKINPSNKIIELTGIFYEAY